MATVLDGAELNTAFILDLAKSSGQTCMLTQSLLEKCFIHTEYNGLITFVQKELPLSKQPTFNFLYPPQRNSRRTHDNCIIIILKQ